MSSSVQNAAASALRRGPLLARSALCGALCGLAALSADAAFALPAGGLAEVNAGGGLPVITQSDTRMDVTLNASRTVLNWTGFNVAPEETVSFNFADRSWIVLNRVSGLSASKIEGVVEGRVGGEYGGNVWFSSNSSIIFGRGARVDAGGILAGIGSPNVAGFLDPASTLFSFSGGDTVAEANLMVLSGATLTAHGGMVALTAPSVVTRANALVQASEGSVLYGSARSYQIRMAPGSGGDFDLVDFIVPTASDGTSDSVAIDLAGATTASSVFLAAVSKAAIGGAIINLEGLVTAQAATADGGDIVLSGGGGIENRLPGASLDGAGPMDLYLNRANASRDVRIQHVGRTFARPWLRPQEESKDPTTIAEDEAFQQYCEEHPFEEACGYSEESCPPYCFAPVEDPLADPTTIASLFDPTAVSAITAGRDLKIAATAELELGRLISGRDAAVEGADVKVNGLTVARHLSVASTEGAVRLASVGVMGLGAISGHTDVALETVAAPQGLTVTSGRDLSIGDGTSAVSGKVAVSAARNVTLNLGSGRVDSVTAGGSANLRGAAVEVGTITAPRIFGQAANIRIDSATTSGDLYVVATSGDASVGSATVGDDIYVIATHGTATLGDAVLTGQAPDAIGTSFAGNPDAADNGRVVYVESTDFDAQFGLGAGGATGATAVTVRAGQDAVVDVVREPPGAFSVVAGRDATLLAPTAGLGSVSAGRDLTVGSTAGDFTLTATLVATRNVSVSAAGALTVGDVRADQGSISLTGASVTAGAVSASEDLTLKATSGGVSTESFAVGRDLIVQGSSLSLGSTIGPVSRDLSITSLGNFTSSTPLSAGRNLILDIAGKATIGQATAGQSVRILAADLDLTGALTAPNAQIESRNGALRAGGSADGSGFVLSNADFAQLRVSGETRIYAGSTTGAARGDLTVTDLSIDSSSAPRVTFLVDSQNSAFVKGVVAPTTGGGILRVGDAADLNWRPGSILVSGSLGAATFANGGAAYNDVRAFDEVRLAARQDILFGSQRFIDLIRGTPIGQIDIAAGLPVGSAPIGAEVGKVFVSAGRLEVSAEGKVVQQNTAPVGSGGTAGLYFTGQFTPQLIIDPPLLVELWGAFVGSGGQVVSGNTAGGALTFTVVDTSGQPTNRPDGATYRFNSCDVGTTNCAQVASGGGGGVISDMNAGLLTSRDLLDSDSASGEDGDGGLAAVSSEDLANPPVILSVAPAPTDEIVTDPVTAGAGSEEIWRKRRQTQ